MKMERIGLLLLFVTLLLSMAFLSACSDDDDPTTPQNQDPPSFGLGSDDQIELPGGLPLADPHAAEVYGYTALVNSISGYLGLFSSPVKAGGPPWVTTWIAEGDTLILTVDETPDKYTWEFKNNGFIEATAWVSKDDSGGTVFLYDDDNGLDGPELEWAWTESLVGVFTVDMIDYEDEERIELVSNPDGSGELEYYEWYVGTGLLREYYAWNALGGGMYFIYNHNEDDETGTWDPAPTLSQKVQKGPN